MSVVCWDGQTLAADRMGTIDTAKFVSTKIRLLKSQEVVAWVGSQDEGLMLAEWYENGADPAKWPKWQEDNDEITKLIVAGNYGAKHYESHPVAIKVESAFMSWGSGKQFAMGAMACGKTAAEAVEIASRLDCYCGFGVDVFQVRD